MNRKSDNVEDLRQVDRYLVTVLLTAIILAIFTVALSERYELLRIRDEYRKITEYEGNQKIFQKYLDLKRDLYVNFNQKLYDINKVSYQNQYGVYHGIFAPLFTGRKGVWGWDKERLDDRYDFKYILEDIFIHDLDYWNTRGRDTTKAIYKNDPQYYEKDLNVWKNLKKYSKGNRNDLAQFFAQNQVIKILFIKDMIQRYDKHASLSDTLPISVEAPFSNKVHDYEKHIVNFLNDSTRSNFTLAMYYFGVYIEDEDYFYRMNDVSEAIVDVYCKKYIVDKFMVYDTDIFSNKLPYSAYIESINKKSDNLFQLLKGNTDYSTAIKPPYIPFEININLFSATIIWIYAIIAFFMYRILSYRSHVIETIRFTEESRDPYCPTFVNIVFACKHKIIDAAACIVLTIISILLMINVYSFKDILYRNNSSFFILFTLPLLIIFVILILRICDLLKCERIIRIFRKRK